jgi:hypothetical protein
MNINNSVRMMIAVAVIFVSLHGCPAQAQSSLAWTFYQSAEVSYVATPSLTNGYGGAPWNIDDALGISSTTYSMNYTVNEGSMSLVRNNNYGLGAGLAYQTSPVAVTQGTLVVLESWLNSGSSDQYSEIQNIQFNDIPYSGFTLATVANPFSEITIDLSTILPAGSLLTSLTYDYTSGASSPSTFVDDGHSVIVETAPEPSILTIVVAGGSALFFCGRKKIFKSAPSPPRP